MILHFDTDYMRGAHPEVMKRLAQTNMLQTPGYGTDMFTRKARGLIRKACGLPRADVFFLTGGTQTNMTVIDTVLDSHEGVVCAESAHINVHESGAIESTGHKVLTLPSHQGKIDVDELDKYVSDFYADDTYEHMVAPGMVYISYPTEFGTLYTFEELKALNTVCKKHRLPLFIDGARLAYGLAANKEVSLQDLAGLCDVFYIGGTKAGALFGEAVVVTKPNLIKHIVPNVKRHGALMAKGRLLGVQFETLFTDNLYQRLGESAVECARLLKEGMKGKGYKVFIDSPTNQQFFILPNDVIDRLLKDVCTFEYWGPRGKEESVVRFVTDWATTKKDIEKVLSAL